MSGPQPFIFESGPDVKRHAPATERNRDVIAETLARVLPAEGLVLEVASGTGEHAVHFARCFPGLIWQPSDPDPIAIASINAWRGDTNLSNMRPAMPLDASADWPISYADAVICTQHLTCGEGAGEAGGNIAHKQASGLHGFLSVYMEIR